MGVQAAVQQFHRQMIGYSVAHKVLWLLQKKEIEVERDEFRKIPAYLGVPRKGDPSGHLCSRQAWQLGDFNVVTWLREYRRLILASARLQGRTTYETVK